MECGERLPKQIRLGNILNHSSSLKIIISSYYSELFYETTHKET